MTDQHQPNRCRLVLVAPPLAGGEADRNIAAALSGGDVASLILPVHGVDEAAFQKRAEPLVAAAQGHGAAVIVAGDARLAFRLGADGIHVDGSKAELADTIARHGERMAVGCGGGRTRDEALELGEAQPDYIFFGRFGFDTRPEPHRRNLALGGWWAEMTRIPCIVLGGAAIESVDAVAALGIDFVALSAAVFADGTDAAEAVAAANARLDAGAPRFED